MSQEDAPFTRNRKAAFAETLVEIRDTLAFMADLGCRGFDMPPETLNILENWGKRKSGGPKPTTETLPEATPEMFPETLPEPTPETLTETLDDIRRHMGDCRRCGLSRGRKCIVFGAGNPHARLMFVGEGPGRDEDLQGVPFVGAAGQLLNKIIGAIRLTREDVYIANIVKCRPPGNRNPEPDEIRTCRPFLERQIMAIQPEFICALGSFAAQTLLNTTRSISRLRGHFHDYRGIRVIPTFHPAYLLRNPERKREVWEDMKMLMREMGHEI